MPARRGTMEIAYYSCGGADIADDPIQPASQPLRPFRFRSGDMPESGRNLRQFFDVAVASHLGRILPGLFDYTDSAAHRLDRHYFSLVTLSVPRKPDRPGMPDPGYCSATPGARALAGPNEQRAAGASGPAGPVRARFSCHPPKNPLFGIGPTAHPARHFALRNCPACVGCRGRRPRAGVLDQGSARGSYGHCQRLFLANGRDPPGLHKNGYRRLARFVQATGGPFAAPISGIVRIRFDGTVRPTPSAKPSYRCGPQRMDIVD